MPLVDGGPSSTAEYVAADAQLGEGLSRLSPSAPPMTGRGSSRGSERQLALGSARDTP